MKTVRLTASILYYLSRTGALLYALTAGYATMIVLFLTASPPPDWLPIKIADDQFVILFPFTDAPFLLGDYTREFLSIMLLVTWGYAIFLLLLSEVFNTFKQQRLFTTGSVSRLSIFYITNLTVPFIILIVFLIIGLEVRDLVVITFLHAVIGVFAFFMAAIFKQGLLLQEEQDLTL